jgi:lipopolysaccharide transport system ATP-binding protein
MNYALRTEKLSKHYRLGTGRADRYRTLRESLTGAFLAPWRRLNRARVQPRSDGAPSSRPGARDNGLWALRDVSFEVQPGDVVGIIGRNGAGKSTLLKVLSRITEPTSGRAELRGRIGSLLEVGTGFHPELTGRENIFLNGAVLGMSRQEVNRKYNEIVAFAEIEQFLDTPVKRYSSGMYVRLAFAVAAHLEPEVLVVDEILAVGDVAFQKRCLQRMEDAGHQGRTILFVSHNLAAVQALCQRAIMLEHGAVMTDGPVAEVIARYLRGLEAAASTDLSCRTDRIGSGRARLQRVEISSGGPGEGGQLMMGCPGRYAFHLDNFLPGITCIFNIVDNHGSVVSVFNSGLASLEDASESHLSHTLVCNVPEMLLAPGRYRLNVSIWANGELEDQVEGAAFFDVVRGTVRGREPPRLAGWMCYMPHEWQTPG